MWLCVRVCFGHGKKQQIYKENTLVLGVSNRVCVRVCMHVSVCVCDCL